MAPPPGIATKPTAKAKKRSHKQAKKQQKQQQKKEKVRKLSSPRHGQNKDGQEEHAKPTMKASATLEVSFVILVDKSSYLVSLVHLIHR